MSEPISTSTFRLFAHAHATHPDWQMAAGLVLAQLRACLARPGEYAAAPTLALLYITDHYARHAQGLLDLLSAELPTVTDWSGTVGVGLAVTGAEYFDEPALAVMLCELPVNSYRVFSGVSPLPALLPAAQQLPGSFQAHTALLHADADTPDCAELVHEMAQRTQSGYVFGGLAASRHSNVQFAFSSHGNLKGQGAASGVYTGGLSGVAFARGGVDSRGDMGLLSRVSQGCRPISSWHSVTACEGNLVLELDGKSALKTLLLGLEIRADSLKSAMGRVRNTLVGLMPALSQAEPPSALKHRQAGEFGGEAIVRHIIGIDLLRGGIAIASPAHKGQRLAFCERNPQAARADLTRICTEIRAALEPEEARDEEPKAARRIAGAVYISCAGRGGPHFGAPNAELQIVKRALGDVPLIGFFAGGEIARDQIYGYTGVLTVFTWPA